MFFVTNTSSQYYIMLCMYFTVAAIGTNKSHSKRS